MRVVALIALKLYPRTAAGVPVAVSTAVDARLPITVEHPVTLSAQQHRLISGYRTAVVIDICFQICAVMAVEAAQVQPVVESHITVCAERHVECARNPEILIAVIRRDF